MRIEKSAVEAARAGDGAQVARLLSTAHDLSHRGLTVWSSPRIARYVEDIIEGRLPEQAPAFYVIRLGGAVAAAVYLRHIDGDIFIDSVYADPSARKGQLSNLLVYRALLDYAVDHSSREVGFDVFESKRAVRAWQQRILGGKEVHRRTWWRLRPPASGPAWGEVLGLEEADRCQKRWGFSRFQVATAGGTHAVGRLPERFFRLEDESGARDPRLLGVLAQLDPSREVLVPVAGDWRPEGGGRVDVLIRSRVALDELLRRLRVQIPFRRLREGRPGGLAPAEPREDSRLQVP